MSSILIKSCNNYWGESGKGEVKTRDVSDLFMYRINCIFPRFFSLSYISIVVANSLNLTWSFL